MSPIKSASSPESASKTRDSTFGKNRRQVGASKDIHHASGQSKTFEPFLFIQGADTQYGLIDRHFKKLSNPGWKEEIASSETLVAALNQMVPRPEFMVICGDLVDAFPWQSEIRTKQEEDLKRVFSKLDPRIALVCVCGNHDIGDEPSMEAINQYKKSFGQDDYFYFILKGVLFIVINSQFYQNRQNVQDYAHQQDVWLDQMLSKCMQFKYTFVFEHIPWFLHQAHEDDEYFNIPKEVRLHWLNKFKAAGVTKIMCGHYHRNAGGWFGDMELVVTSAIGAQFSDEKSGARLVKVQDNSIEHHYYSVNEMPKKVSLL